MITSGFQQMDHGKRHLGRRAKRQSGSFEGQRLNFQTVCHHLGYDISQLAIIFIS
jgi:hypothetical protein